MTNEMLSIPVIAAREGKIVVSVARVCEVTLVVACTAWHRMAPFSKTHAIAL